jgi:hypothetical protein
MSVEYRDLPREGLPSFLRPIDRVPSGPRDPMSTRYGQAHRRSPSWVSVDKPVAPAPEPIPVPTPVINARGLAEMSVEEYMTVDPDEIDDLELASKQQTAAQNRKRGFVGGFVSGLRRLPKAMLKSYSSERKPVRQATASTLDTAGSLPQYTEHEQVIPDAGPSVAMPNVVTFVDTTPVEEPAPMEDEELEYQSHYSHHTHHTQHTQHTHHTHQDHHYSHSNETDHQVHDHSTGLQDQTIGQDPPDGETTVVHHEILPATLVNSPQFSMASDYENNMTYSTPPPSDVSLGTHFARVRKFFRDLNDLPWVSSSRIVVDYFPGEENRKRYRSKPKPKISWYPTHHTQSPLDLLGSPPEAVAGSKRKHNSVSTSSIAYHDRSRSHRQQQSWDNRRSPPRGYGTMYPHGYVPYAPPGFVRPQPIGQPLYAYTNGSGPPMGWNYPEMQQAMPVYVLASPPHGRGSAFTEPISRPPPAQTA